MYHKQPSNGWSSMKANVLVADVWLPMVVFSYVYKQATDISFLILVAKKNQTCQHWRPLVY